MEETESRIQSEIDFDRPGTAGRPPPSAGVAEHLHLGRRADSGRGGRERQRADRPHRRVHGDEYGGPIVVSELARELRADQVSGRVIMIPAVNPPAMHAVEHLSPIGGLDMNRCFPAIHAA